MKKFQRIFNGTAALIIVVGVIFTLSFVAGRINDFREQQNAIKTNVNYISPPERTERYEEIITQKNIPVPTEDVSAINTTYKTEESEEEPESIDCRILFENIVREFSGDKLVFNEETMDYRTHNGIDIETKENIPALFDGYIEKTVKISDSLFSVRLCGVNGENAIYEDIIPAEGIKEGNEIKIGEIIGKSSESNGNIFHLGVIAGGNYVNPTEFFN